MKKDEEAQLFLDFQKSPILFIERVWGLTPERDNNKFVKGKHISWQQHDILLAVESALRGEKPRRISVAAGRGIGKTTCLSWLILWYLYCFKDAQLGCTSPTSDQLHDVLWKEIAKWLGEMPEFVREKFEWSMNYVRVRERSETWFARARTARKEAPEALSGLHGEHVMLIGEEASGIEDVVMRFAEGSLTDKNTMVILISNPTRLIGYFYNTQHKYKEDWQTLQFNGLESPLVDIEFVEDKAKQYGVDSDEYRISVLGQFPKEDAVDDKGYVPLLTQADIKQVRDAQQLRLPRLGVDAAGEGSDKSSFVARDRFRAKIMAEEKISNAKSIAQKISTLTELLQTESITVDNFGVGANVAQECAFANIRVNGVNVGDKADDPERFVNKRAEAYFRLRDWLRSGGELVQDERWDQLLTIRYKRNMTGRIVIMSKQEMRKEGYGSPDHADALSLTFCQADGFKKETLSDYETNNITNVY
jgi:hypothetical protein